MPGRSERLYREAGEAMPEPGDAGAMPWPPRSRRTPLEDYLNCKYKAHLRLAGQRGTKSDYEAVLTGGAARQ